MDKKKTKKQKKSKKMLYIIIAILIIAVIVIITLLTKKKYPKKIKLDNFTKQIAITYFQDYFENIESFENNEIMPHNVVKYIVYKNLKNNIEEISLQNIINEAKDMFNVDITEMDIIHSQLFEYNMIYSEETKTLKKLETQDALMMINNLSEEKTYAYFITKIYQTDDNTYEIWADVISPNNIQDFIEYYSSDEYFAENNNKEVFVDSSKFTPFYNLKDFLTLENYEQLGTKIGTGKLTIEYEDGRFIIKKYNMEKNGKEIN